jgi:hypothetical protein
MRLARIPENAGPMVADKLSPLFLVHTQIVPERGQLRRLRLATATAACGNARALSVNESVQLAVGVSDEGAASVEWPLLEFAPVTGAA